MRRANIINYDVLWNSIGEYARKAGRMTSRPILLLFYVMKSKDTPWKDKMLIFSTCNRLKQLCSHFVCEYTPWRSQQCFCYFTIKSKYIIICHSLTMACHVVGHDSCSTKNIQKGIKFYMSFLKYIPYLLYEFPLGTVVSCNW